MIVVGRTRHALGSSTTALGIAHIVAERYKTRYALYTLDPELAAYRDYFLASVNLAQLDRLATDATAVLDVGLLSLPLLNRLVGASPRIYLLAAPTIPSLLESRQLAEAYPGITCLSRERAVAWSALRKLGFASPGDSPLLPVPQLGPEVAAMLSTEPRISNVLTAALPVNERLALTTWLTTLASTLKETP